MHNPFSQFLINQENSYRRTKSFLSFKLGRTAIFGNMPPNGSLQSIPTTFNSQNFVVRKLN